MSGEVIHRLGIVSVVAAVLGAAGAARSARRARAARRRLEQLLGVQRRGDRRWPRVLSSHRAAVRDWAAAGAAGIVVGLLVGGLAGAVVAVAVTQGVRYLRRRTADRASREPAPANRRLPFAAELLAACLAAGAAPGQAADAVGRTLDGPLGEALRQVAAELRLGGDPAQSWARLAAVPGAEGLARWMVRAATTGVPPVAAVSRLAAECRSARARSASAAARKAAVLATAPLGLCFLPAFLAVGVVPVVVGLAAVMTRG